MILSLASMRRIAEHVRRAPDSSLTVRFARGAAWSVGGSGASQALGLVAMVLTARALSLSAFGEFAMIRSTIALFGTVAGLGVGATASKHVAEFRARERKELGSLLWLLFTVSTGASAIVALAFASCAHPIARHILRAPHLAGSLQLAAVVVVMTSIDNVQTGILSGFEQFQTIAQVNLISGVCSVALYSALARIAGVWGATAALMTVTLCRLLLNRRAVRSVCRQAGVRLQPVHLKAQIPILWQFSVPVFLSSLVTAPAAWATNAILARQPGGYASLGLYNGAVQWMIVTCAIPNLLAGTALPFMAYSLGTGDNRAFGRGARRFVAFIAGGAMLANALVSVGAPLAMGLFGRAFRTATPVLLIMLATATFAAVSAALRSVILAASSKLQWPATLCFAACGATSVSAMLLLQTHGAVGRAGANLAADTILLIGLGCLAKRALSPRANVQRIDSGVQAVTA